MKKYTDEEILELTTLTFTDNSGNDVIYPLEEVQIIGNTTVRVGDNSFKLPYEHISKIIIKKGRYNLLKGNIDVADINKFIETRVNEEVKTNVKYIVEDIQAMKQGLESMMVEIVESNKKLKKVVKDSNTELTLITDTFKDTHSQVEKVMDTLQVLIED